jgi:hypothetical protein
MPFRKSLLIPLILGVFLVSLQVQAQPQISGPQAGNLGPGTYIVVGDIQVQPGRILTIAPGTTFLHNGHWYWYIYGQLIANGTESDSIKFIRQQEVAENRWGGIRFMLNALPGTLSYCVIDYALISSAQPSTFLGAGIFSDGVALTISHSRISHCDGYWGGGGMYIRNTNAFTASNCTIVDNNATSGSNGGGFYLYNVVGGAISYCMIARNGATGT